jgi:hypothetical protein
VFEEPFQSTRTIVPGLQIQSVSISFISTVFSAGFLTRGVTNETEVKIFKICLVQENTDEQLFYREHTSK